ncbi:MAG: DUF1292 domain-containing protein [Lachnospiraceae bacterium]|nr:DUF1292 domain-containing protein [Lachnospiraceae bacterium]
MDKICFKGDAEEIQLYVLDSTRLAGKEYLLVSDVEEGDGDCFILEEIPADEKGEAGYVPVEDDELLDYLASIFGEQLEDVDIEYK